MANRPIIKWSTLLIIGEVKSKQQCDNTSQLSEWLSSNSTNSKCWEVCGEKGTFVHCQWEYKLVQPQGKTVWSFLKRKKKKRKKILKQNYYMVQHDHSWVYIWNKQKHLFQKIHSSLSLFQHYLIAKIQKHTPFISEIKFPYGRCHPCIRSKVTLIITDQKLGQKTLYKQALLEYS